MPTDDQGRMRADAFARSVEGPDGPMTVVTQAGQLNTGAFDPMAHIPPVARAHGAWVHVDGAFGLRARANPLAAPLALGFDQADSRAFDGRSTRETIARVQSDGVPFAGGARWRGRWVMRLSVISAPTTPGDAERSVAAILDAWRRVG